MTELVGYLRTSTDSQEEGLETQREQIRLWAVSAGTPVTAWFTDEGVSGSNGLENRLGLAEALSGPPGGIVVYKLDRLARDLVIQETILAEARRLGIQVHSTLETENAYLVDDPKDPTRKLIRQVLGAVADYERAMIRLRMTAGAARKKAAGGYAGGGIPYGFRAVVSELVKDTQEQKALRLMRSLRKDGASLRDICAALEDKGFPPRRGASWHPQVVARILGLREVTTSP